MRVLPFRAIYPNLDFITSNDSFFESVKEEYSHHRANGFFLRASEAGIYLYEIAGRDRTYLGLIATVDIQDYLDGRIKKHEQTLTEKEQVQIQLLLRRNAAVKPVLLGYPRVEAIDRRLSEQRNSAVPFLEVFFERDRETHRLWQITDPGTTQAIQTLFLDFVPQTYIADGHHRATISAILHQRMANRPEGPGFERLLCALFGSDQLEILDYNRVIDGLHDLSSTRFMAQMARYFKIKALNEPVAPRRKHELILFVNKEWYRLRWRKQVLKGYKDHEVVLDTMLLNEKVLAEVFGIEDVRNDGRVQYVEGPLGLEGLRQRTLQSEYNVGFALYPVQLDEMIRLVDAGETLPPKSTWFEPRMKNGLIVYPFSDAG